VYDFNLVQYRMLSAENTLIH